MPLSSFQASKRFLLVLAHYLTVLCPLTTGFAHRAPTSRTPPRKMQRQRSMNLTRVEWEDPALASPSSPSWATTQETPAISIENLTIRGRVPSVSTDSPLQSPRKETRKRPYKQLSSGERLPRPRHEDAQATTPPTQQNPAKKWRRVNHGTEENTSDHSVEPTWQESHNSVQMTSTTQAGTLSLTGRIEHGQIT